MGKYKPFILLGTAIFVALITSLLVYNWLQGKAGVKHIASVETRPIAVAVIDLPWGSVLSQEKIRMVPLPKGFPGVYFPDPAMLVGRVLVFPVKANEPILESRLAPRELKTGGVAAVINAKKRAIAVKVDKVIGVSGFVHPGNRVDVLVTLATGKTSDPVTKTVLENVLVLATGPEMEKGGKEEKQSLVDVITLEVTPEEAEKLALAVTEGRLQLVLRNFSDTEDVLTQGMTIPTLLASYGSTKETRAAARKTVRSQRPAFSELPAPIQVESKKPTAFTVEFIKGSKVDQLQFEGTR